MPAIWKSACWHRACGCNGRNATPRGGRERRKVKKQVDFTEGNIVWAIVRFSIPLILGELLQNLYNSVDALVAGNLVDQNALAAVTVCGVIANLVVNFFNAMSIGSNVVVAKANGSGERERLCHTIRVTFSFGVVLGVLLSLFGILLSPQLLRLAGAQESYLRDALIYLRIYLAGLMFTVIYNNAAGILRALGRADIPFRILVVSCGMNIVLDLLFVSAFDMGIAGVGVATVLSQAVSVAMAYRTISREIQSRCLDLREMYREGGRVIGEVLCIGMAAGVQSALISFSNIFVVRYMNWFSADAVAGIGIAQRLDRFVILPAKSFGITMTTFLGQNLGAGKYRRIETGEKHCAAVAVGVTLGLSAIIYAFTEQCVALFSPDAGVIASGVAMMRILAPTFWIMALREVLLGILRGCGHNLWPTVLSLIGMVGVRQVFLAVTMHIDRAVENIYYCYPVAWAATLLLVAIYYFAVRKTLLPLGKER